MMDGGSLPASSGAGGMTTTMRTYVDRLEYRLPPFFRSAWASAAARDRWSEPLVRLADEVRTAEWMSVVAGVRLAAIVVVPRSQVAALSRECSDRKLGSHALGRDDATKVQALIGKTPGIGTANEVHLVTRSERMNELEAVWRSADLAQLAVWLGYPPCCATFLKTAVVERQCLDTTWAMTWRQAVREDGTQIVQVAGCTVNPLLSALGLRATPHRPCCFHCEATQRLAKVYDELRAQSRAPSCQDTLEEVLDWPMEWSSLHGIVEVKVPVLTLCYDGDATARCYRVRLISTAFPEHAAQGLNFPYQSPPRSPRSPSGTCGGDSVKNLDELIAKVREEAAPHELPGSEVSGAPTLLRQAPKTEALSPGLSILDLAGLAKRLRLSPGTGGPEIASDPTLYQPRARLPLNAWRELGPEELDILGTPRVGPGSLEFVTIVRPPLDIIEPLLRHLETLLGESPRGRASSPAIESVGARLARMYSSHGDTSHRTMGIGVNEPGMETVSVNKATGRRPGLHVDGWSQMPTRERAEAPNRLTFNLGPEPRRLLFINLPVDAMLARMLPDTASGPIPEAGMLAREFMRRFPRYPVLSLDIAPGEAYIAPTDNMIHDGCTLDMKRSDIFLSMLGYFDKPHVGTLTERSTLALAGSGSSEMGK